MVMLPMTAVSLTRSMVLTVLAVTVSPVTELATTSVAVTSPEAEILPPAILPVTLRDEPVADPMLGVVKVALAATCNMPPT